MEAKALNKEALQAEVGLPVDRKVPLVAFIGRLEEQKGPDVMVAAIKEVLKEEDDVQIVLLGTGKKKFERMLKSVEEKFPEKVRAVVKFNAPLAHQIMAGADVLAVTSRFEPCGLIQLQGMRYGTVDFSSFPVSHLLHVLKGFHSHDRNLYLNFSHARAPRLVDSSTPSWRARLGSTWADSASM